MNDERYWLLTILDGDVVVQVALASSDVPTDVDLYPMEPESRKWLHDQLPEHIKCVGPIVGVQQIACVYVTPTRRDAAGERYD